MLVKRSWEESQHDDRENDDLPTSKRRRAEQCLAQPAVEANATTVESILFDTPSTKRNYMSTISDELLIRILSFFSIEELLSLSRASKHFHNLTGDSQLWRPLFYHRFILPRAHLIPGFRRSAARRNYKIRLAGKQNVWADGGFGRRGCGLVDPSDESLNIPERVDWRQAYKLRLNWEHGRCAVNELPLHAKSDMMSSQQTFARFVEGLAVTVNAYSGLRAWDLRTRELLVQADLAQFNNGKLVTNPPTCLAIDDSRLSSGLLDIVVGFEDGTLNIWALNTRDKHLALLRRHREEKVGGLVSVAYSHPYVMTATNTGFILLYTFDYPETIGTPNRSTQPPSDVPTIGTEFISTETTPRSRLPQPYLLNSLKSRDTRPARALSFRKVASSVVASFAWTFDTVEGWCIAVQDLDIRPSGCFKPDIITSRLAISSPTPTRKSGLATPEGSPSRVWWPRNEYNENSETDEEDEDGPVRLCYSHPYLLVTMPDNTLILYLCTATANSLTLSSGSRLFGHTSGISDAIITPAGKAVSVSSRGNEIRLWELEGGTAKGSVEVRPRQSQEDETQDGITQFFNLASSAEVGDRRNWVGFDDEMVIVLKEQDDGAESFMVYDFT